jgi:hypothetical protein
MIDLYDLVDLVPAGRAVVTDGLAAMDVAILLRTLSSTAKTRRTRGTRDRWVGSVACQSVPDKTPIDISRVQP